MANSSLSQCKGKGSIGHNNREFYTDNIDRSRTSGNVVFVNQPIGEAYKKLFDGALQRYNDKQKRPCRRIEGNYYDSLFNRPPCNQVVESTCKRKSFYEDLVQVGDKDTCGCGTPNGKLAEKCLTEYMDGFHRRNPNFYVFNAVMHVDEATPHLHINYIPVGHYKRGMDTQNGYNQALKEMGFTGPNCFRDWRERERAVLRNICKDHGLDIKPPEEEKGRGHSFTVEEYKKEKDKARAEINKLKKEINTYKTQIQHDKDIDSIGKKQTFGDKYIVDSNNLEQLKKQSKGHIKLEKKIEKLERELNNCSKNLSKAINARDFNINRANKLESRLTEQSKTIDSLEKEINNLKGSKNRIIAFIKEKGLANECNEFCNDLRQQEQLAAETQREFERQTEKHFDNFDHGFSR